MAWKSRIHPNKVAIPVIVLTLVAAAVVLWLVGDFSLSPAQGREVIAGALIALASSLLAFGYIILRGLTEDNKAMVYRYLIVGFVTSIALIVLAGLTGQSAGMAH